MRAYYVERAGFGSEDELAVEFAEDERADAERVARANELLVRQGDQGIGAFELPQRFDEALDQPPLAAAGDELQHDLGIRGRLVDRAFLDQAAAKGKAVRQV